jgi:hypothetical protein
VFTADGAVLLAEIDPWGGGDSVWWWAEAGGSYRFDLITHSNNTLMQLPEPGGLAAAYAGALAFAVRRPRRRPRC